MPLRVTAAEPRAFNPDIEAHRSLTDCMDTMRTAEWTLRFGEPGLLTTPPLGVEFSVRPELRMRVLFPSYFWHGTVPIHSDQPRLTVTFDVVPDATQR